MNLLRPGRPRARLERPPSRKCLGATERWRCPTLWWVSHPPPRFMGMRLRGSEPAPGFNPVILLKLRSQRSAFADRMDKINRIKIGTRAVRNLHPRFRFSLESAFTRSGPLEGGNQQTCARGRPATNRFMNPMRVKLAGKSHFAVSRRTSSTVTFFTGSAQSSKSPFGVKPPPSTSTKIGLW